MSDQDSEPSSPKTAEQNKMETEENGSNKEEPISDTNEQSSSEKEDHDESIGKDEEKQNTSSEQDGEKDNKDEDDEEEESDDEPQVGMLERPLIIEDGKKRERKKVERMSDIMKESLDAKPVEILEGKGRALGDIPFIEHKISRAKPEDLKLLYRVLFRKPGKQLELRKHIRQFSGFPFPKTDDEYKKRLEILKKLSFTKNMIQHCCEILDVPRTGNKEELIDRLMEWLEKPADSGRNVPKSKKRKRSKSTDGKKKKGASKGKKTDKKTKKSDKAESSDNEDDDDADGDEEEEEKEESEDEAEKSEEEQASDSEDEAPPKKKAKKATPKPKAAKKEKKEASKPAKEKKSSPKKKPTPKKKAAKAKPAEDEEEEVSDISSDSEDEPLVKEKEKKETKKKQPPTNEEIKDLIKNMLDDANLEEVTMKTVLKDVFAKYPGFDLTDRKEFIKNTVKKLIS
ncbi:protein DEK-like isoform X1 [Dreissena polymorpha]|uniref:protein DEK-like isoform X1 n=1 Tax=Dreissena polymorpha TaxID=45954 RepID=UPI002263C315|nr:protein DEK-like isoform X1 [Dreissena polymorpha]XP_052257594.1 protein DEK-like isoform X1 [Dreissena polymorpha]XP_052257595.1 protein DEK-like isoform X1 [Dreissena polymorpha]